MAQISEKDFVDQLFTDLQNDNLILPTLPEIAIKVRETLEDEESSLSDVAKIIAKDTALSARIIQVANSPLLRTSNPIEGINTAVMRMGSNMIRTVVTSMVMEQMFQATSTVTDTRLRATWKRSTDIAAMALSLSQNCPRLKKEQAMLAGLIHDIGILPILSRAENHPELLMNEQILDKIITTAHTSIGAAILTKWHFPEELIMVAIEHENLQYDSRNGPDYVDLIIVANLQAAGRTNPEFESDLPPIPAFEKLGLSSDIEYVEYEAAENVSAAMFGA